MDSIILFFIFFLGLTPVSAILYPVMWMYNLVKYCQLNSYSYTYPRHPEERKKLILTCQKAVKYRVTILKVIFFTFLAIFIASSYLAYSQNFMMISSEYTYIIAVMSLCQVAATIFLFSPNKYYKKALLDIQKGSFIPYSHRQKKIHQAAVVTQVNIQALINGRRNENDEVAIVREVVDRA